MTTISIPLNNILCNKSELLKWIAKQRSLFFSNQDDLLNNIIAIDSNKKELVYLNTTRQPSSCTIINLQQLSECSVTKHYNSINAGDLKKSKLQHFIKSIFLTLLFKDGSIAVKLPLYKIQNGITYDINKIELKAKKWHAIICSLLPGKSIQHTST